MGLRRTQGVRGGTDDVRGYSLRRESRPNGKSVGETPEEPVGKLAIAHRAAFFWRRGALLPPPGTEGFRSPGGG